MQKLFEQVEMNEIIKKLEQAGYGDLVDALINNEEEAYTRRGRLNKCGACRVLGWKIKDLDTALDQCRELLAADFGIDLTDEQE